MVDDPQPQAQEELPDPKRPRAGRYATDAHASIVLPDKPPKADAEVEDIDTEDDSE